MNRTRRKGITGAIASALIGGLALAFASACSKPPVSWNVASASLSVAATDVSSTVGLTSTYSIQGGVSPFRVTLSGLGSLTVSNERSILFRRPWQTGTGLISVTDFLGQVFSIQLNLTPGAVQIGGGGDPASAPLQFRKDATGNLYLLGSTQAVLPATQYGTPGNQYLYLVKIDPSGSVVWMSQLGAGPTSTTTAVQLLLDNSNNCFVLGATDGVLPGLVTGARGVSDGFVAKFSPDGSLLWLNDFGGGAGAVTSPLQMAQGANGFTYVTGVTSGTFGGTQSGFRGDVDAFAAAFSSNGTLSWINQLGGGQPSTSVVQQMFLDSGGNTFLMGTTDGDFGGIQSGVHGSRDAYLARFSSIGAMSWVNQWGGGPASTTTTRALAQDSVGRTDIIGFTTGTGGTQIGAHGSQDAYIAQVNAAGTMVWTDQLGAGFPATVTGLSIVVDATDNLYWVGTTDRDLTGFGATPFGTLGTLDALLVKLTSAGVLTWMKEIGGGNLTTPSPVIALSGGNLFLNGVLNGNLGGLQFGTPGNQDAFLTSFTTAGTLNWMRQIGGGSISTTSFSQSFVDAGGNIFLVGETTGSLGGGSFGAHGNRDVFYLKVNSAGAMGWVSQLGAGGSSQTFGTQLLQDNAGNSFLLGHAQRLLIGSLNGPNNFENSYMLKINPAGELQ